MDKETYFQGRKGKPRSEAERKARHEGGNPPPRGSMRNCISAAMAGGKNFRAAQVQCALELKGDRRTRAIITP